MAKTLSKSWFAFAGLAGLATAFIRITPPLDATPSLFTDALVPGATVTLRLLAFGLVYRLIEKAAPNKASERLGWLHLGLIAVATAIELAIDILVTNALTSETHPPAEALAGGIRILGGAVFILAIALAIRNAPKLIRKDMF